MNWIRTLKVIFTEHLEGKKGREIVYGDKYPNPDLEIEVIINKYAATMKDTAVITITNMTYDSVINITRNKIFDVKVVCGYRNGGEFIVFDGAVSKINNTFLNGDRSNKMIILCTSKFIARYCQNTLNFTLTSGLNVYSAIKFMCGRAGISEMNTNVSTQLKKQFLNEVNSVSNQSISSFIDALTKNNPTYIVNTDNQNGAVFSIFDAAKSNSRVIKIKNSQLLVYPTLSSSGLRLSVLPTFNFKCGDTIMVNNALINLEAIDSLDNLSQQSGIYLDTSAKIDEITGDSYGAYMVLELEYRLSNRSAEFSCNIIAKARSLISNYVGGSN